MLSNYVKICLQLHKLYCFNVYTMYVSAVILNLLLNLCHSSLMVGISGLKMMV